MKIYKTQKEVEKDIKDGVLTIEGDVEFECSISIEASINAGNINAWDIKAWNIKALDILYYTFCCVYQSIKCSSIKAKREIHQEPICLEGKLEIKDDKDDEVEIVVEGKSKIISRKSAEALNLI